MDNHIKEQEAKHGATECSMAPKSMITVELWPVGSWQFVYEQFRGDEEQRVKENQGENGKNVYFIVHSERKKQSV